MTGPAFALEGGLLLQNTDPQSTPRPLRLSQNRGAVGRAPADPLSRGLGAPYQLGLPRPHPRPWAPPGMGQRSSGRCRSLTSSQGRTFPSHPTRRTLTSARQKGAEGAAPRSRNAPQYRRPPPTENRSSTKTQPPPRAPSPYLRGGLRLPPGDHRRLLARPQRPPFWGRDTDFRAEVGGGRHPWKAEVPQGEAAVPGCAGVAGHVERLRAGRPPPGDRGGLPPSPRYSHLRGGDGGGCRELWDSGEVKC